MWERGNVLSFSVICSVGICVEERANVTAVVPGLIITMEYLDIV